MAITGNRIKEELIEAFKRAINSNREWAEHAQQEFTEIRLRQKNI